MTYKDGSIDNIASGVITGYSRQQRGFSTNVRQLIRNLLVLVIISLILKKFAMKEIPVWYFTRPYPVDTRANAGAAASPALNEPLSDFDDYNLADVKRLVMFIIGCLGVTVPFFF